MKEKILSMVQSPDREIVALGILFALNEGEDWCYKNLPRNGYIRGLDNYKIKINCGVDSTLYKRGTCSILLRAGYLHCREYSAFPHRKRYNIIDL